MPIALFFADAAEDVIKKSYRTVPEQVTKCRRSKNRQIEAETARILTCCGMKDVRRQRDRAHQVGRPVYISIIYGHIKVRVPSGWSANPQA